MKITAEPRSDQWNADDFVGGPRTFTISGVKTGKAEQKYDIDLLEGEGRAWRPPLTMLRVLLTLWGDEAAVWEGRRVTLYRDAAVRFGGDVPGGIRISHMSDIGGKTAKVPVTVARGKRALYVVEPLPDLVRRNWAAEIEAADLETLKALWSEAPESLRQTIETRAAQLKEADVQQPTGSMLPNATETTP